ncbi:MAG TPA: Uma2 family endonuclease [Bryobacteraceae bacterium]|jgi:Uma2 family endonuclease|nr:Uma2 family endonuclease [Bryobacteraceae bacterium]
MTVVTELQAGDRQVLSLFDPANREAAFEQVCRLNPDARIEQNAEGEIIVMAPAGGESGYQSGESYRQLANWSIQNGMGRAFDASTGFILPNGAKRSPDAAWVHLDRIRALPMEVRRRLAPLAPDFAIEVMSPSDRLADTQAKCREYIANGTTEAWLIDPERRTVWVYSKSQPEGREIPNLDSISSDSLAGFTLDLRPIWQGLDV